MIQKVLKGTLLDDRVELTMHELCEACSISSEWVLELVQEGVVEPVDHTQSSWRFSGVSLQRARTARRLQADLEVNLAGVALALDLMDEIDTLRERLSRFEADERS